MCNVRSRILDELFRDIKQKPYNLFAPILSNTFIAVCPQSLFSVVCQSKIKIGSRKKEILDVVRDFIFEPDNKALILFIKGTVLYFQLHFTAPITHYYGHFIFAAWGRVLTQNYPNASIRTRNWRRKESLATIPAPVWSAWRSEPASFI